MTDEVGKKRFLSEMSTTHRLTIRQTNDPDQNVRHAALQRFLDRYLLPIQEEIRRFAPWAEREEEDLASEFKLDLITRSPMANVSPDKGRFRDWLKKCIHNFLIEKYRQRSAAKRGGKTDHVSADTTDEDGNHLTNLVDKQERQDDAFDRAWAKQVVHNAIAELENDCVATRREALFKELKPTLTGIGETKPYTEIAAKLNLTEGSIKTAANRMRQRLGELIREEVAESVGSKADVDDEISFLMSLLKR